MFVAVTQTKGLTTKRNITVLALEGFAKAAVISSLLVSFGLTLEAKENACSLVFRMKIPET